MGVVKRGSDVTNRRYSIDPDNRDKHVLFRKGYGLVRVFRVFLFDLNSVDAT